MLRARITGARRRESVLPEQYLSAQERQIHVLAAKGLAISCAAMYGDQPTGLGVEEVVFLNKWEYEDRRDERAGNASRNSTGPPSREKLREDEESPAMGETFCAHGRTATTRSRRGRMVLK